jgi:hypothetical protein
MKLSIIEAKKVIRMYLILHGPSTSLEIRDGLGREVTGQFPKYIHDIIRGMGQLTRERQEGSRKYRYYVRGYHVRYEE